VATGTGKKTSTTKASRDGRSSGFKSLDDLGGNILWIQGPIDLNKSQAETDVKLDALNEIDEIGEIG
jgi:hypothetical protein